jgi:CheY-like chemotaxis protein
MESVKTTSKQRNILVVESDKELVRSMKDYVDHHEIEAKFDLKFIFVGNSKEALRRMADHEIDLVVLEILLPIVNGYYLLKEIKSHQRQIPVIVYTRLKGPQDLARLAALKVDNIFIKQLMKMEDLVQVIISYGDTKVELDKVLLELQSQIKSISDSETQAQLKVIQCPRCHMILNRDSYFCNNCGQKIFKTSPKIPEKREAGEETQKQTTL